MAYHEKLSEKAQAIIAEEGDWWGTRLLNQLVQEGCSAIKESQWEIDHGLGLSCLGIVDFLHWVPQQLSPVADMFAQLGELNKKLNSERTGQTKEQIVGEIITGSEALVECYRTAYVWMRTIEVMPVDSRCINAAQALARCAEPITESIDELTYAMYEATEDNDYELRKGHSRRAKVELTAESFAARVKTLEKEIEPVMAILKRLQGHRAT